MSFAGVIGYTNQLRGPGGIKELKSDEILKPNPVKVKPFNAQDSEYTFLASVRQPGSEWITNRVQTIKADPDGTIKLYNYGEGIKTLTVKSYINGDAIYQCRKKQALMYADTNVEGRIDFQIKEGNPYALKIEIPDHFNDLMQWLSAHNVLNKNEEAISNPSAEYCNNLYKRGGKRKSKRRYKSKKKTNTKRRKSLKKNNKRNKSRRKY